MKLRRIIFTVVIAAAVLIGGGYLMKGCQGKSATTPDGELSTVKPPSQAQYEILSTAGTLYYSKEVSETSDLVVIKDYWAWINGKWVFYSGEKVLSRPALGGLVITKRPKGR